MTKEMKLIERVAEVHKNGDMVVIAKFGFANDGMALLQGFVDNQDGGGWSEDVTAMLLQTWRVNRWVDKAIVARKDTRITLYAI